MTKTRLWMLAAIVAAGSMTFSCSDELDVQPQIEVPTADPGTGDTDDSTPPPPPPADD